MKSKYTEDQLSRYTEQQLDVLHDTLAQPGLVLRAAKIDYVNHVLMPDGTLTTDFTSIKDAAQAAADSANKQLSDFLTAAKQTDAGYREAFHALTDAARAASYKVTEIQEHIDMNQFLFIPGKEGLIYFQCAVHGNPDIDWVDPESPEFADLSKEAKAAIKANRDKDLAAWEARKQAVMDGYAGNELTVEEAAGRLLTLQLEHEEVEALLGITLVEVEA